MTCRRSAARRAARNRQMLRVLRLSQRPSRSDSPRKSRSCEGASSSCTVSPWRVRSSVMACSRLLTVFGEPPRTK